MLTGMERIMQLVDEQPNRKLQTLMHLVNKTTLKEAHQKQETGKAAGVDKVTKAAYEKNLDENLDNLISRMKTFSYRPQPVRRTYIEKEGSEELRPLGIPAYEDRLVQGVISEILNIIYEPNPHVLTNATVNEKCMRSRTYNFCNNSKFQVYYK
jgi:retron-type reverse transcriptase